MFHIDLLLAFVAPHCTPIEPVGAALPSLPLASPIVVQSSVAGAASSSNWYARLNAGLVTTDDSRGPGSEDIDFDEGFLLSAAVGQRVTSGQGALNVDIDVEGLWTEQDASTSGILQAVQEISVLAALLNVTLDVGVAERVSIYAGGGVGPAWMDIGTGSGFQDDDGPFLAWQVRAGLEWHFASGMTANVGYRFLNIDDANIDDGGLGSSSFDLETQQHALEIGLRFGL